MIHLWPLFDRDPQFTTRLISHPQFPHSHRVTRSSSAERNVDECMKKQWLKECRPNCTRGPKGLGHRGTGSTRVSKSEFVLIQCQVNSVHTVNILVKMIEDEDNCSWSQATRSCFAVPALYASLRHMQKRNVYVEKTYCTRVYTDIYRQILMCAYACCVHIL